MSITTPPLDLLAIIDVAAVVVLVIAPLLMVPAKVSVAASRHIYGQGVEVSAAVITLIIRSESCLTVCM